MQGKLQFGVREVEEEIGLKVKTENLISLGMYTDVFDIEQRNIHLCRNREFVHTYFYKYDKEISDYVMQEDEVDGLFEIDVENALKLFSGEVKSIEINGVDRETKKFMMKSVSIEDFTPIGDLFIKIFIMAERLL